MILHAQCPIRGKVREFNIARLRREDDLSHSVRRTVSCEQLSIFARPGQDHIERNRAERSMPNTHGRCVEEENCIVVADQKVKRIFRYIPKLLYIKTL